MGFCGRKRARASGFVIYRRCCCGGFTCESCVAGVIERQVDPVLDPWSLNVAVLNLV